MWSILFGWGGSAEPVLPFLGADKGTYNAGARPFFTYLSIEFFMKKHIPQIRILSPDHERTTQVAQKVQHAMTAHDLSYPVHNVFCHLESGRCGVRSGTVALEVDGGIVWVGEECTDPLADAFCRSLIAYLEKKKAEFA